MDFRKHRKDHTPLFINREREETVTTFGFLGTHIFGDLSWTHHIKALVEKAQQRVHFLRFLRKNNLDKKLQVFYHSSVKCVLTYCLGVW